ncbi:MAG: hypothetical protein WC379_00025 [Methanoregula sp.]|jgi:hypothetical protein
MQLPRGTFREIRKNVAIESLLHDLETERFSGVANISSQSSSGTLVFKTGKCILVKIQNSRGDAGWDEVMNAGNIEVDAALSLLGDAQIDLALEFNKPCRILKAIKNVPSQASARAAPAASHEHPRTAMAQKAGTPFAPMKPQVKPAAPARSHVPAPQAPAHTPPPHPFSRAAAPVPSPPPISALRHEEEKRPAEEELPGNERETTSFETDLDTFDTMDFDNVTDKIRSDCKTMIKQLHLDHLMER